MPTPLRFSEENGAISLQFGDRKLNVHQGDIVTVNADALVCPVDQSLNFDAGLARIVTQAAGRHIRAQKPVSPEPFGKVVVLPGGKLNAKYIFMTVLLGERGLDKIRTSITQAVERSIKYAEFLRLKSIAFPVLGNPKAAPPYDFVARAMLEEINQYFHRRNTRLKAVLFSAYNPEAFDALRKQARNLADA